MKINTKYLIETKPYCDYCGKLNGDHYHESPPATADEDWCHCYAILRDMIADHGGLLARCYSCGRPNMRESSLCSCGEELTPMEAELITTSRETDGSFIGVYAIPIPVDMDIFRDKATSSATTATKSTLLTHPVQWAMALTLGAVGSAVMWWLDSKGRGVS